MARMRSPYAIPGFGKCIYCGTPGTPRTLTDEHTVPKGLGGKRYIEDASCEDCRGKTHAFETAALEGFLWPARAHAGVRPSRPARRRKSFPVLVERPSPIIGARMLRSGEMPTAQHPYIIAMPAYPPPRKGRVGPSRRLHDDFAVAFQPRFQPDYEARVAATRLVHGGPPVMPLNFAHEPFMRMLAKIAHCEFMAAVRERPSPFKLFTSGLRPLIRDEGAPLADYVGGHDPRPSGEPLASDLHRLRFRSFADEYAETLVTEIQLFAPYAMPIYQVLTGVRLYSARSEIEGHQAGAWWVNREEREARPAGTSLSTSATQWR